MMGELVRLRTENAALREAVMAAYCTAADAVALGRVRYADDFQTCSPWTELQNLEQELGRLIDELRKPMEATQ